MPNLLHDVRPRSHGDGVPSDLYVIAPRDRYEAIGGKPTLLTDYHLDEMIACMRRTTYDPDLMQKLKELRAEPR